MTRRTILATGGFCILLILWVAGAYYVRASRSDLQPVVVERLYPLPHQVFEAAADLPPRDILINVRLSATRVMAGFALAALFALPFGFAIGRIKAVAHVLEPSNDFLRYLPVAGFTSLAIFLIGTGDASAILVVFIGTVFHLTVATADAVRRVPDAYLDLARTMNFGAWKRLRLVILPASAPAVYDNLRVAVGWAWSYVTLAEIMGTEGGLGHAIEVARRYIRTDQVLFWILMVGVLGLVSDQIMRLLGRRWFRWVARPEPRFSATA